MPRAAVSILSRSKTESGATCNMSFWTTKFLWSEYFSPQSNSNSMKEIHTAEGYKQRQMLFSDESDFGGKRHPSVTVRSLLCCDPNFLDHHAD